MDVSHFCSQMEGLFPHPPHRVGVAVSGGSDSLCLLYYLQQWLTKFPSSTLYAFIVHHGLRPDSLEEAQRVKQWIEAWGLSASILAWTPPLGRTGLMERARKGRYETLALACHRQKIQDLFLGHHQEDLLETVWMRQERGSHWRGLAGISALTFCYGVRILRPLLGTKKETLRSQLRSLGHPWVEDPSNEEDRFSRVQARKSLSCLSPCHRRALMTMIHSHQKRREGEAQWLAQRISVSLGYGYVHIPDLEGLQAYSEDQGTLLLRYWMASFSFSPSLTMASLTHLWAKILCGIMEGPSPNPKIMATGGGCLFLRYKGDGYLFREWGRLPKEPRGGSYPFLWDSRFFCYGGIPVQRRAKESGPWKHRWALSSFPDSWPDSSLLYRWCSVPIPHFSPPWNLSFWGRDFLFPSLLLPSGEGGWLRG